MRRIFTGGSESRETKKRREERNQACLDRQAQQTNAWENGKTRIENSRTSKDLKK